MLIVAIPKSASTALMETLARAHAMACDMHFKWRAPRVAGYEAYHRQHNFGWELTPEAAQTIGRADTLFKVHLLPSANNVARVQDIKKIVLLRAPEGIIGAYRRGEQTRVYRQKTHLFDGCSTDADWLARAREIGIFQDLEAFSEGWRSAPGDQLIVDYEKLVTEPGEQIARIETYLSLAPSGVQALLKRKYTRAGTQSFALHKETENAWKKVGQT